MKYYAVKKGLVPGVYTTWDECKANVEHVSGAQFKSFNTLKEAEVFAGVRSDIVPKNTSAGKMPKYYAFVDGSFNPKTGVYGYGGFLVNNDERFIIQGFNDDSEMAQMRNVAGEICGAMAAVTKATELGIDALDLFYDYQGIESWATGTWKCNKTGTIAYRDFMNNSPVKVTFHKVKGHSGIEGNEEADRLAKEAVGII